MFFFSSIFKIIKRLKLIKTCGVNRWINNSKNYVQDLRDFLRGERLRDFLELRELRDIFELKECTGFSYDLKLLRNIFMS